MRQVFGAVLALPQSHDSLAVASARLVHGILPFHFCFYVNCVLCESLSDLVIIFQILNT
jgi:hypothetical protein